MAKISNRITNGGGRETQKRLPKKRAFISSVQEKLFCGLPAEDRTAFQEWWELSIELVGESFFSLAGKYEK